MLYCRLIKEILSMWAIEPFNQSINTECLHIFACKISHDTISLSIYAWFAFTYLIIPPVIGVISVPRIAGISSVPSPGGGNRAGNRNGQYQQNKKQQQLDVVHCRWWNFPKSMISNYCLVYSNKQAKYEKKTNYAIK